MANKTLLQAFATEEGFYAHSHDPNRLHNRPQRNNNPGDLEFNSETIRFHATHGDPRFAVFPDVRTGWKALQSWLSIPGRFDEQGNLISGYLGATLHQVVYRFAPPSENNSVAYLTSVCESTGLTPSTIVTPLLLESEETN